MEMQQCFPLCDKAFNIAKNPKYNGYQRALASMVYNLFIKNLLALILLLCAEINLSVFVLKAKM